MNTDNIQKAINLLQAAVKKPTVLKLTLNKRELAALKAIAFCNTSVPNAVANARPPDYTGNTRDDVYAILERIRLELES